MRKTKIELYTRPRRLNPDPLSTVVRARLGGRYLTLEKVGPFRYTAFGDYDRPIHVFARTVKDARTRIHQEAQRRFDEDLEACKKDDPGLYELFTGISYERPLDDKHR